MRVDEATTSLNSLTHLDSLEGMKTTYRSCVFFCSILMMLATSSCAYNLGYEGRGLPGGYDRVAIPIFENQTEHVGIEVYFTNSLVREFERARIARVTSSEEAPLILEGVITTVGIDRTGLIAGGQGSGIQNLPSDAVLSTEYRLLISAVLLLRRKSDRQVLWQGGFQKEGVYSAPRIGSAGLNSANANYNKSVREQRISQIAEEMMEEAHDRMTENF